MLGANRFLPFALSWFISSRRGGILLVEVKKSSSKNILTIDTICSTIFSIKLRILDGVNLKIKKRIENFLKIPVEIKFSDFEKILNFFGYYLHKKSTGSSHEIFVKEGVDCQITIPRVSGTIVKQRYIKMVIKQLSINEWYDENKDNQDAWKGAE